MGLTKCNKSHWAEEQSCMCNEILQHYIIAYVTSGSALYFSAALNRDHFFSLRKDKNKPFCFTHRKLEKKTNLKKEEIFAISV